MRDTGFVLSALTARSGWPACTVRQADGSLAVIPFEMPQEPEFFMGGGGLYSTGPDYLRFLRMLLGNGQLDGARMLQPETVAEMSKNQIGELRSACSRPRPEQLERRRVLPGHGQEWGLGYMINTEDAPVGRTAGSLAWAGLANTYYWIDPTARHGRHPDPDPAVRRSTVLDLFEHFERAIYAGQSG